MCMKTVITLSFFTGDIQPSVYFLFIIVKRNYHNNHRGNIEVFNLNKGQFMEFIGQELQIVITNDALMISDNNIFMITSSYCCVFLMHEDITLCMFLKKYLQQC